MREAAAIPYLAARTDKPVTAVSDPVFFLDAGAWEALALSPGRKAYILVYVTEPNRALSRYVKRLARERGLCVVEVRPGGAAADPEFEADVCAGPAEFPGYIRHASFVATNSFHAAAFSLIFQKEFLVFAHSSRNARLENLLAACGLGDRLIREGEEAPVPARPVCWDGVAERIRQMAGKSRAYLVRALTGGQQENGEDRHADGAV